MIVRVVHVITGLGVGGAETMLAKLLETTDLAAFPSTVVSLRPAGPVAERIRAAGVTVHSLGVEGAWATATMVPRLARVLRRERPALVQTWMYHADLAGGIAARMAGVPAVVWNLRNTQLTRNAISRPTRAVVGVSAALSRIVPDVVVSCAQAAVETHVAAGYDPRRMRVIPNGFDLDRFQPDLEAGGRLKQELGLSPASKLVGLVARYDPVKDHVGFLTAFGLVRRRMPEAVAVLVGSGLDIPEIDEAIRQNGLDGAVHRLGGRSDVHRLYPAFDVSVSSSTSEGFSNAIGEAMACGCVPVVTDVGDSARIVGKTGRVVPPSQPDRLAEAILEVLTLPEPERQALGRAAAERVARHFSLASVVRQYEDLYRRLAHHGEGRRLPV